MADLLVQARPVPAIHAKPNKSTTKPNTKAKRPPSKPTPAAGVVATLNKAIKDANNALLWCKDGLTEQERERKRVVEERRQILCARMQDATNRLQWDTAAQELDVLEGNEEWKQDSTTGDYNPDLIEERLQALDEARTNCDTQTMMHLIRTALSRDLGGMDNVDLYRQSYSGTKHLIERYVKSTIKTIEAVVTQSQLDHGIEHRDLLDGILFARQSYGRSALLLSGGGTFGMSHIGVLKCLFEAKLLPRIISGASAGSIVCAAMCTRTDEQIPELIRDFPSGDLSVFDDPDGKDGVWGNLRRLLTEGSWSDIKHLTRVMQGLIGDTTFQEAYNRTRRILNICVSTASVFELPRLLNYVTAPNVMIWSAVAASCSVPLVFNASPLLVKDPATGEHLPWNPSPQRWIDGSVDNDLPMTRLAEMFNVNHFIVSQVNPHVVPFLSKDDHLSPTGPLERDRSSRSDDFDWVCTLTSLAKDEALHRLHFLAELGVMPNLVTKFRSILSQKYSGDINILPEINMNDLPRLMSNPTSEFMIRACLIGERATWPKLSRIRDRCAIELALDHAVHRLRDRVIFSESQRDLRRMHTGRERFMSKSQESPMASSALLGPSLEMKAYRRNRRQSGGSLHVADRWALLDGAITDDETEKEERLEMQSRRSRAGSPVALRKPRLKRASRSHIHIQRRDLHVNMVEVDDCRGIDFSKPLTPPFQVKSRDNLSTSIHDVVFEESGTATPDPWSDHTWPSKGNVTSPAEDVETSEPCHSSDENQDTEASDPEPYEMPPPTGPSKSAQTSGSISPFRPEERAGWVLWD